MPAHVQVWLGRRVSPEHHSAEWQALADSPRPWAPKAADTHIPLHAHCKLVAAKQHVTVACIVDCAAKAFIDKLAVRGLGAGSPSPSMEEVIAEELCNRFCLYWRHEDLHDAGLSLPPQSHICMCVINNPSLLSYPCIWHGSVRKVCLLDVG